ncbi:flagellin N-methylase, partial [Alcaligenes phenolicus]
VAQVSAYCRTRCIEFIDAQLALIGMNIETALARRHADDRPATRELRGFTQALERARHALAAMPAPAAGIREDAERIDAWLADRTDFDTLAA